MIMRICCRWVSILFNSFIADLPKQCAIPAVEGLLPEPHNTCVLNLLFHLAHWHALTKLRMHTDTTLDILSKTTTSLGNIFQEFEKKTCGVFQTQELEREQAARQQCQENTAGSGARSRSAVSSNNARRPKCFNLKTYKYHALGDYVSTIRLYGTTDSYSTQMASCYLTCSFAIPLLIVMQSKLEH
jgi:hypothetical protein